MNVPCTVRRPHVRLSDNQTIFVEETHVATVSRPAGAAGTTDPLGPIVPARRRESMASEVARHIRSVILDGRLGAGDDIGTEGDLAERFGVSRPTLREALSALEAQGVLTRRAAPKGLVVAEPQLEPFSESMAIQAALMSLERTELLDAQSALEVGLVDLVVQRIDAEAVSRLDLLNRRALEHLGDQEQFATIGMEFHREVAALSGNRLLNVLMAAIATIRREDASREAVGIDPSDAVERNRQILAAHESILAALTARDGDAARAAMHAHLEQRREAGARRGRP